MSSVTQRFIHSVFVVALALAMLSGCAVAPGVGQSRLALEGNLTARYTVCTGVQASRLRAREQAQHLCRRSEGVRVIL